MINGPKIANGIHLDLPDTDYHSSFGVSNSDLKIIADYTPMHLKYWQEHKEEPTPAMIRGSLIHLMVLQPELWDVKTIRVPADAPKSPTRAQRNAKKPSPETLDAILFWDTFNRKAQGKQIVSFEDEAACRAINESIRAHPIAGKMLNCPGKAEISCFMEDEETGETIRCRMDWVPEGRNYLLDLKTVSTSADGQFRSSFSNLRYYQQGSMYSHVWNALADKRDSFIFVAVEAEAPYGIKVYEEGASSIQFGLQEYRRLLKTYSECRKNNVWPSYPEEIEIIDVADYKLRMNM